MSVPALPPVVVLPHPDRIARTAVVVSAAHGMTGEHADRLAAALAYLLVRFAGMACTGELEAVDDAAVRLRIGKPVADPLIGQYRRESAAILTGRSSWALP